MTRQIDPELVQIAARYAAPPTEDKTAAGLPASRAASHAARVNLHGAYVDEVTMHVEDGLRRFVPNKGADPAGVVVYIHGGGWITCDTVTHMSIMEDLAALTGYEVIGPEYPLAPEEPYPAAHNHLMAFVEDVAATHPNAKLYVGGDSAGANLSLGVAAHLRDAGKGDLIAGLFLWYGCYRREFTTPAHQAYGGGEFGLTTESMRQAWAWYLQDQPAPYGELSGLDVTGLPPAWLCEAELDCLASDTRWLAGKYAQAGIDHAYDFFAEVNHGFNHYGADYPPALQSIARAAHFIKRP